MIFHAVLSTAALYASLQMAPPPAGLLEQMKAAPTVPADPQMEAALDRMRHRARGEAGGEDTPPEMQRDIWRTLRGPLDDASRDAFARRWHAYPGSVAMFERLAARAKNYREMSRQ